MSQRRELRFKTLEDVRRELTRLEKGTVVTTGNWSYFQILNHCGKAIEKSVSSFSNLKSWWVRRFIGPIALRKVFKQGYIPAGAGAPVKGVAAERIEGDEKAALAELRKALDDFEKYTGPLAEHPFFGKMKKEQWTYLIALHGANHLGFVKLKDE